MIYGAPATSMVVQWRTNQCWSDFSGRGYCGSKDVGDLGLCAKHYEEVVGAADTGLSDRIAS